MKILEISLEQLLLGNKVIFLIIFLIVLMLLLYFWLNKVNHKSQYKLRKFITKNEADCFKHLKNIFPDYHICPQVSMGALLEPIASNQSSSSKERSNNVILRNKIQSKVIDFVMLDKNLNPIFIIELDDSSHDSKKDKDAQRDLNLSLAGIKTARFRRVNGNFPSRKEIEIMIK